MCASACYCNILSMQVHFQQATLLPGGNHVVRMQQVACNHSQLMPIVKHLRFPVGACPARLAALLWLKPPCCICHDWSPGPCPWCVCMCMPEGGCDPAG